MPSLIADLLDRLDEERRYEFAERAGIIEFENGQQRDVAECLALIDLLRMHAGALVGVTTLEVRRADTVEFVITTDMERTRERIAADGTCVVTVVGLADVIRDRCQGVARVART